MIPPHAKVEGTLVFTPDNEAVKAKLAKEISRRDAETQRVEKEQ